MIRSAPALALGALTLASPATAQEVNVYFYRELALIQPLMDALKAQTDVTVKVALFNKGLIERLHAEGRCSPAGLVLTVDISRLHGIKNAGPTQPVQNGALTNNISTDLRRP
jgi:iron(III) transport system substrate-binding protein